MQPTVLNRLIAARHLLEASGPHLTASSTPSLLAQKLLSAHDAAELVLNALSSQPKAAPCGSDGKPLKDPSFMQLARSVVEAAPDINSGEKALQLQTFQDLVEARKLFKHSGLIVDVQENAHLFGAVVAVLEELTEAFVKVSISSVDRIALILDPQSRDFFERAQQSIAKENYKEALENIAWGLAIAFSPHQFTAGKPSSEDALMISGRGVDPSMFLAMQRLLPVVYLTHEEPEWNLRGYGHPANWTDANARFCLDAAIDTASKLQRVVAEPYVVEFYEWYEDVIEIEAETPEAYVTHRHFFGFYTAPEKPIRLKKGDKVTGHAYGRFDRSYPLNADGDTDLSLATWIAIENSKLNGVEPKLQVNNVFWVRRDQASISFQIEASREKIRDYFAKRAFDSEV